METPLLLIIFNRPDTTKLVFDAIRKAKPSKLYVSADAPREGNDNDILNCNKAKEIVKNVDWECETHYRFSDKNLGCGWGPASAISWAFEKEDRLIILEDDCVPSISFFPYCNYLLEKYINDTRIWLISGRSHESDSKYFKEVDYLFSHYGHSWGWATWKRCWQHFDMEMKNFPDFIKNGGAENTFFSRKEGRLYNEKYKKLYNDKNLHSHVWDFQFGFSLLSNGALCIVPAKNLIENIGVYGTHSSGKNKYFDLKAVENFIIKKEPKFVLANREFDYYHFNHHIVKIFGKISIFKRIIRKSLKIIRKR
jgi:hypothetical protein